MQMFIHTIYIHIIYSYYFCPNLLQLPYKEMFLYVWMQGQSVSVWVKMMVLLEYWLVSDVTPAAFDLVHVLHRAHGFFAVLRRITEAGDVGMMYHHERHWDGEVLRRNRRSRSPLSSGDDDGTLVRVCDSIKILALIHRPACLKAI